MLTALAKHAGFDMTLACRGDQHIDDHHKELFELDTLLDQAIATNRIKGVLPVLTFLEHYVLDHFKEEEDLMDSQNYTESDYHKLEHKRFKEMVHDCRKISDEGVNKAHLIFKIRLFTDALMTHIKTVDSGLASITQGHSHDDHA